jgi:hypothetical protein
MSALHEVTPLRSAMGRLGRSGAHRRVWQKTRGAALTLLGFASLDAAAFTVSTTVGLISVGVSCFLLEWLSEGDRG